MADGESAVADALRLLRLRDLAAGDSSGKRSRTRPSVVVLSGIAFVCVSVAASVLLDWLAPHRQIKFREGKTHGPSYSSTRPTNNQRALRALAVANAVKTHPPAG